MSNGDFQYPAKGDPKKVRHYYITDREPPEGYTKVADFPLCAFQVALNKLPAGLYRKDELPVTEGVAVGESVNLFFAV